MNGTPHISASPGEFAELVLMPGDPLRARALAEGHLDDVHEVNSIRNMLGFTGLWKGKPVSIMGSGMGMPSISIYAQELFHHFGVKRIVRVGTCGGLDEDMRLGDLILATAASTDSNMNRLRFNGWDLSLAADFDLARAVSDAADSAGLQLRKGEVFSTDWFYHPDPEFTERLQAMRVLALDMETAALYATARQNRCQALTLLSVSDVIPSGLRASSQAREQAFAEVIDVVLEALLGSHDAV